MNRPLVGCVPAALGLTALLVNFGVAHPLVAGVSASAAVWIAWVALDLVSVPRAAQADAQAEERQAHTGTAAGPPPAFADTQATWMSTRSGCDEAYAADADGSSSVRPMHRCVEAMHFDEHGPGAPG